ncbi:MAG: RidA family protein, partial [Oscillospiraceae bacterium]
MKEIFSTDKAPAALGPYSQGICTDGLMFVSGQTPIDSATGDLVPGGITEQTHQALRNVRVILETAGLTMDNVVKTTVFLHDMNDFAAMNAVYGTYFTAGNYPCRSAFQVVRLPKDCMVEIEAIAV